MYSDEINKLSKKIITIGAKNKVLISTAESCTGGMIGSVITSVPGSSSVYDRGFVTYSNESKVELLDIDINLINKYGAVSKEIAVLMAEGCLKKSYSNLTVSVTGVAGPGGGTFGASSESMSTCIWEAEFDDSARGGGCDAVAGTNG